MPPGGATGGVPTGALGEPTPFTPDAPNPVPPVAAGGVIVPVPPMLTPPDGAKLGVGLGVTGIGVGVVGVSGGVTVDGRSGVVAVDGKLGGVAVDG